MMVVHNLLLRGTEVVWYDIMMFARCTTHYSSRNLPVRAAPPGWKQASVNEMGIAQLHLYTHLLPPLVTRQSLVPVHHHVVPSIKVVTDGLSER